ncbi:MAG: hypothetical protein U0521_11990 [Anaerolineae bacterium]
MSTQITQRVYFPGLNALRFYAAFSVMIVHIGTNFAELRKTTAVYPLLNALAMDARAPSTCFSC